MNKKLGILLFVNAIILLLISNQLSISFHESELFFNSHSALSYIVRAFTTVLGQNDIAIRLPMIIFHLLSVYLLHEIAKPILLNEKERIYMVAIFVILPGVISASLLVNAAGLVIFLTLLYLYERERNELFSYFILALILFVDSAFAMLYLALFIHALYEKKSHFAVMMLTLFVVSMLIFGFDTGGKPKTYFLDTFAIYAAIFSPLLFVYLFYTLYRILIKEKKSLLFFIATATLVFSFLLSFRQRIPIESFAPFLTISMPLVAQMFLRSYYIRLKEHRSFYRNSLMIVVGTLIFSSLIIIFNPLWYYLIKNPDKHFARNHHIAKDLAHELKNIGISNVRIEDKRMTQRLRFYGIGSKNDYMLSNTDVPNSQKVTIRYMGANAGDYYILK